MTWEWVPPVVTGVAGGLGVFFTWLTAAQGRSHTERMTERARSAEQRAWLRKERRDAYLEALRYVDLELRRARYKRESKAEKLAQLDEVWPKGERVRLEMEALIGVSVFGSEQAQVFAREWSAALESEDEEEPTRAAVRMREQVRRELNLALDDPPSGHGRYPFQRRRASRAY